MTDKNGISPSVPPPPPPPGGVGGLPDGETVDPWVDPSGGVVPPGGTAVVTGGAGGFAPE